MNKGRRNNAQLFLLSATLLITVNGVVEARASAATRMQAAQPSLTRMEAFLSNEAQHPGSTPSGAVLALALATVDGATPNKSLLLRFTTAMREHESNSRYGAKPREGMSASGAYQAIESTWNGFGGYRAAYLAPAPVQDLWAYKRFIRLWQQYNGDWDRVAVHHFLPALADEPKSSWSRPLPSRYRDNNPPSVLAYLEGVREHIK